MSGTESRIADLIAGLQHLRVEADEPFCWRIKASSLPWSSKQCDAERDRFLASLLTAYPSAVWCTDALKNGTIDKVAWSTSEETVPRVVNEGSHLGDWLLLLFAAERAPSDGMLKDIDPSATNCGHALQLLEATGSNLLVYSMPDDLEWLIATRD